MKNILAILVLLFFCGEANAQVVVSGQITKTNGDTVRQERVYMYSDTTVSSPVITLTVDTTDTLGQFSFVLSNTIPGGTVFYVSTLDCDNVSMKTNTHIFTGNNINSPLQVCVTPSTKFSGYVHLGDASLRPDKNQAKVYLIEKCAGNFLTYIDSVETDTNGYFSIAEYPTINTGCELVMQARLKTSSQHYKKYIPAYYESASNYSLRWSGARDIPYLVAKSGVVILMPKAVNPHGGPSKISGVARNSSGTILPDKVMFITDYVDIPVDYLYTTHIGDFSFFNLPFGRYKLFGDVWGKDNPELVVKVDADGVYIDNIVFTESNTEYKGHIAVSVSDISQELQGVRIYPNPVNDVLYIKGIDEQDGEKHIILRSITGSVVMQQDFAEGKEMKLSVADLQTGVYFLKLSTPKGIATFKLIK